VGLFGAWCGVAGRGWEQMAPLLECHILLVVLGRGMVWAGLSRTGVVRWDGERLADRYAGEMAVRCDGVG
jgi:hypothetical protein